MTTDIPATGNLTDDVVTNARDRASSVQFSRRSVATGAWEDVTMAQFHAEVCAVAKGLSRPASSPATGSR